MRPGISCWASSISVRPKPARPRSATLKSGVVCVAVNARPHRSWSDSCTLPVRPWRAGSVSGGCGRLGPGVRGVPLDVDVGLDVDHPGGRLRRTDGALGTVDGPGDVRGCDALRYADLH